MDLSELIRSRRTVGNYSSAPVDDVVVQKALELSLWAPNHKLTYPWVYVQLGAETRAALADLAVELKRAKGGLTDIKAKAIRDSVTTSSHVIALARRRADHPATEHEDYATLACSVQIASMYLWENGVASKWSSSGWCTKPRAYEIMGLNPAEVVLEGALLIGKAQAMPPAPPRPALAQVLRRTK